MTRSGRLASQQPGELSRFIDLLAKHRCASYLEIGARHGDTFYEIMKSIPGMRGVAVDLPNGPWGGDSKRYLIDAVEEVGGTVIFGDSTSPDVIEQVKKLGPFDAVLIDGDHRYEGVKADFENYRCPITAFHDIDGEGIYLREMPVEVPRFWREIKDSYPHVEIIDPSDDRPMGIGVIFDNRAVGV